MNTSPFKFDDRTPAEVRELLTSLNASRRRVRVFYGDAATGRAWMEENMVTGTIGKSTGPRPIPLLVHNARSTGGPGLLDGCIVKIIDIAARNMPYNSGTLYEHPNFSNPADRAELVPLSDPELPSYVAEVQIDGEVHARFRNKPAAVRYMEFMQGKRFSK